MITNNLWKIRYVGSNHQVNISYEQIRAFVVVAETGSFSAAAKVLNRHRTTVGQVVDNLEIEINMALFDRAGKSPVLTAEGEALFKHAKSLSDNSLSFSNYVRYSSTVPRCECALVAPTVDEVIGVFEGYTFGAVLSRVSSEDHSLSGCCLMLFGVVLSGL